ncbi:MAG: M48 family metalloprotease [Acidobacteria bacterium]|nr:M48 family metalloprotease [Acidobacteriota bacterium]
MTAHTARHSAWRSATAYLLLAVLALPIGACATNPVTGKNEFSLMTEAQEIQIGRDGDKELRAEMGVYDDAALQQYVEDVGMRLAQSSQRPNLPWHFAVVDVPDVNAFALPGGYVYITRGLLAYLGTEAEMAGVLGHEIGHVTARHAAQGYTRQITMLGSAALLSVLYPKAAPYAMAGAVGLSVLFLKYDRNQELQADRLGTEYSANVGWSPEGMEGVLQAISRLEGTTGKGGVPNWLLTHPPTPDRIEKVDPSVQALLQTRPESVWTVNREPYLSRIDGLMYGDNPHEGVVRGNVFVHPDLRLRVAFPAGWEIDNGKKMVTVTPKGSTDAMMLLESVEKPSGSSLEDVAVNDMRTSGFELLRGETTQLNGLQAFVGTYEGTMKDVGIVRMQAAHMALERQVFMLGGVAARSKFSEVRGAFSESIGSVASISREEAARIRPSRIRFVTVRQGDTWASLAARTGNVVKPERLAVLNRFDPGQPPPAGQRIKIVQNGE